MAKWTIKDEPLQIQPKTIAQQAARIGAGTGLSALRGLENIASFVPSLLLPEDAQTLKQKRPSQMIQEGLGYEDLEPQNLPERFLQRGAEYGVPALLSGGLRGLQTSGAGSAVASLLGETGFPEGLQDAAQLATEILYGKKISKNVPTINNLQKKEYDLAQASLKPNTSVKANLISDAASTVEKNLATEVSKDQAKKIKHVLHVINENINKGKINPAQALSLRKSLYQLGNELPNKVTMQYLNPLTKGINDFFAVYAAENPAFFKHLKTADKLTELKNMNLYISRFLDKAALGKIPGGQVASDIINFALGETERFGRGIINNSEARKYYFNAISSIAKNNPTLAVKNLNKLNREIDKSETLKPKWIIKD